MTRQPMGAIAFRDPIVTGSGRKRAGLGANATADITAGASVGTAILPGIGTGIGAAVGAIAGLFGGGHMSNPNAVPITNKWYNWYLGRAADSSGASWWPNQINADGVANAWMNFSTSKEPVQKGAAQLAATYQALGYGAPTDPPPAGTSPFIAPPTTIPYSQYIQNPGMSAAIATTPLAVSYATPYTPVTSLLSASATPQQIAAATPAQQAALVQQASVLGGLSGTTLLLLGGGLLVGFLLMNRSAPRSEVA